MKTIKGNKKKSLKNKINKLKSKKLKMKIQFGGYCYNNIMPMNVDNKIITKQKKYEEYKTSFNDKPNDISNVHEKIQIINTFENNIIIILGANNSEPHISNFAQIQPSETTIICISEENKEINLNKDIIIIINNNPIIFIKCDFNSIELWNKLSKLIEVSKIIFDWSTTKFLQNEFNLVKSDNNMGEIMKIIFNLLVIGGRFYTDYEILQIIDITTISMPYLYNQLIENEVKKENASNLLTRTNNNLTKNNKKNIYIEKYKQLLDKNKPSNYEITFFDSINDYPLSNEKRKTKVKYNFLYFEKKNI